MRVLSGFPFCGSEKEEREEHAELCWRYLNLESLTPGRGKRSNFESRRRFGPGRQRGFCAQARNPIPAFHWEN